MLYLKVEQQVMLACIIVVSGWGGVRGVVRDLSRGGGGYLRT
jgi:hypothetical protein